MSSANEHLAPPAKPKLSPLEFRNTDLVSRLLAATPPYLYNMSLLPNTYFFSEMLRSFVQAKTTSEQNKSVISPSNNNPISNRRSRKRPYSSTLTTGSRNNHENYLNNNNNNNNNNKALLHETPLELTTSSVNSSPTSEKIYHHHHQQQQQQQQQQESKDFLSHHHHQHQESSTSSGLILPPPPPMWYPPLYPTAPYGIDPLHFFIDLRVSGHIYDRKSASTSSSSDLISPETIKPESNAFRQSRHSSAFSVPYRPTALEPPIAAETKNSAKFDVKSLGFEKRSNRTGTSYITSNLINIYKQIDDSVKSNEDDGLNDEEKEKKVKDLRALIGLELVVDYVNHAKPRARRIGDFTSESNDKELEDGERGDESTATSDSPTLEVVALLPSDQET